MWRNTLVLSISVIATLSTMNELLLSNGKAKREKKENNLVPSFVPVHV